jgi:hypothetical protein
MDAPGSSLPEDHIFPAFANANPLDMNLKFEGLVTVQS